MLRVLRESAGSWMIKVLMGLMVAAFVLVGTGSYKAYRSSKIASVNGENISAGQYQTTYYNIMESVRRQFGNQLNDEMLKLLNIQKQALDQVIETTLMRQAAKKYGISVSEKELADSITRIPAFQKNGAFDMKLYNLVLSQNRLTPESFEAMQQQGMLIDRLKSIVTSCVKVSGEEGREWYTWDNASEKIDYVFFSPDTFKNVEVTDPMLEEYYNAHKEEFKTAPARKVRYVKFDPAQFQDKIDLTDDEVKEYYTEHEDEFKIDETVSGKQILLKVPEKATPEEADKKKQEAEKIIEKAKAGEDFAELVKTYSEGVEKEKGGNIGPFTREGMPPPIADKVFTMEVGQISDPIRTNLGWNIFKLESRNPAGTMPLQEVSDKIRAKLASQREKDMAYDTAAKMYDNSLSGDDLVKNAALKKLQVVTTDFFSEAEGPAGMNDAADFAKTAFKLPLMEVSEVAEIGNSYYLIQALEQKPEEIPALDAVKEKVRESVLLEQQEKAAQSAAKKFLDQVRGKGSIAATAQEAGLEVKTVDLPNRHQSPPPELGNDASVTEAAFQLSEKDKFPENPIKGGKGYYVIELKERNDPIPQGYPAVKTTIIQRILQRKQMELFKSWVADLRKNSTISISDKVLNQQT